MAGRDQCAAQELTSGWIERANKDGSAAYAVNVVTGNIDILLQCTLFIKSSKS